MNTLCKVVYLTEEQKNILFANGSVTSNGVTIAYSPNDLYVTPEEIDSAPVSGGTNPISSGGVYTALAGKQNALTFDTSPTANSSNPVTSGGIYTFVNNAFTTNDAMVFKGTIGSGGTVTSLPATHYQGWTYKVITAGSYAGQNCEIGDMIICITDGTSANNAHWTVVQSNVDGAVTGPSSSTSGRIATFNGTTGKVIQDSGYTIATSVPSNAKFTDTTYTATTTSIGSASAGTAISADDITAWSAGTVTTASVANGVLTISPGTPSSLSYTPRSIPNISVTSTTVATGITAD